METKDEILKRSTFNILWIIDPIMMTEYKDYICHYLNGRLKNAEALLNDLNERKEQLINYKDYQTYQSLRGERNLPVYEIDKNILTNKEEVKKFIEALDGILEDAFCTYGRVCLEEKLRNILNIMKQKNNYLYQNLESIYKRICTLIANQEEKSKTVIPLYFDELIDYTKKFLEEIDPSKNLSKKFTKMLEDKQICIWSPNSLGFRSEIPNIILENFPEKYIFRHCCFQNKKIINFPRSGQLKDFYTLIHEFFHLLFIFNKEYNVLHETISIIMEKYTRHFLEKKKKYTKEELDYTYIDRIIKFNENIKDKRKYFELLSRVKKGLPLDNTDFIYYYLTINYQFYFNLFPYSLGFLVADYIEHLEEKRKERILTNIVNQIGSNIVSEDFIEYFFYVLGLPELNYIFASTPKSLKYLELPDKRKPRV